MSKYSILLFICLFISDLSYAQQVIVGRVVDEQDQPISYASISHGNLELWKVAFTDADGLFHLQLLENQSDEIEVKATDYYPKTISGVRQLDGLIKVVLVKNPEASGSGVDRSYLERRGLGLYAGFDIVQDDFGSFESILGTENVETLNQMAATFNFEMAFMTGRLQYGFLAGLLYTSNQEPDSIDIELNNSVFGLTLGYRIINHRRFFIMPNAQIKWYKYRLINADERDDNELGSFVQQSRDLDLRFWQPMMSLGGTLAFKFDGKVKDDRTFWTLGIYGGYIFNLRKTPSVNGVRSVLNTEARIAVQPLNIGIFASVHLDPKRM